MYKLTYIIIKNNIGNLLRFQCFDQYNFIMHAFIVCCLAFAIQNQSYFLNMLPQAKKYPPDGEMFFYKLPRSPRSVINLHKKQVAFFVAGLQRRTLRAAHILEERLPKARREWIFFCKIPYLQIGACSEKQQHNRALEINPLMQC